MKRVLTIMIILGLGSGMVACDETLNEIEESVNILKTDPDDDPPSDPPKS